MPIVMLTTSREESDVVNALQSGARGYLLKDMEPDELIKALERYRRRPDRGRAGTDDRAGQGGAGRGDGHARRRIARWPN